MDLKIVVSPIDRTKLDLDDKSHYGEMELETRDPMTLAGYIKTWLDLFRTEYPALELAYDEHEQGQFGIRFADPSSKIDAERLLLQVKYAVFNQHPVSM